MVNSFFLDISISSLQSGFAAKSAEVYINKEEQELHLCRESGQIEIPRFMQAKVSVG